MPVTVITRPLVVEVLGDLTDPDLLRSILTRAASLERPMLLREGDTLSLDPSSSAYVLTNGLTLEGQGYGSVIKIIDNAGDYDTIFQAATSGTNLQRVTFRNLRIDQNATGNTTADVKVLSGHYAKVLSLNAGGNITFDHVWFDPYVGVNAISISSGGDGFFINGCHFVFERGETSNPNYDTSALYLDIARHRVTDCDFYAAEADDPPGAIESHNGRSVIAGNTINGFRNAVNVVGVAAGTDPESNDITVTGNTITNTQFGIVLWSVTGHRLRNVTVANNTIAVNQVTRDAAYCSGIAMAYEVSGISGEFDAISITDNTILFEDEGDGRSVGVGGGALQEPLTYAIGCAPAGTVTGVHVEANTIINAPVRAIRWGNGTEGNVTRGGRIANNLIINAGQNILADRNYRGAIFIESEQHQLMCEHNQIIDTNTTMTGYYSIYANPSAGSSDVQVRDNHEHAKQGGYFRNIDLTRVTYDDGLPRTYASATNPPASGRYASGDLILFTGTYSQGIAPVFWRVNSAGSYGSLVGVTVSSVSSANRLTLSSATAILPGDVLKIQATGGGAIRGYGVVRWVGGNVVEFAGAGVSGMLVTDDVTFSAPGIVPIYGMPMLKAGTISDADFSVTPSNGAWGLDSGNNRAYFRVGGTWKYTALT